MAIPLLEQFVPTANISLVSLLLPMRIAMVFNGDTVGGKADIYMVAALWILTDTIRKNLAKVVK
jgi:hypothetical protein